MLASTRGTVLRGKDSLFLFKKDEKNDSVHTRLEFGWYHTRSTKAEYDNQSVQYDTYNRIQHLQDHEERCNEMME